MVNSVYKPFKKQPFWQPNDDMCVTTAIKNVIDNQFNVPFPLSEANKLCKYNGKCRWGIAIDNLEIRLTKILKKMNIKYNWKEQLKIDDLYNLLEKGIYPIVIFHLSKYNKWAGKDDLREVSGDGELNLHFLIIVGIDKDSQKITIFDTLRNKFINYGAGNLYKKIVFVKFLEAWVHKEFTYPAIWFSKIDKNGKINKEQTAL